MDKSSASSWYDSVYVVQFKSKTDYDINGTFGFDLPSALGGGTKSYSLKISRAQASTVSTLKYLTVARTKVTTPTAESWKTAFEHVADDKSRDSVLLDKFDATSPVLSGKYVANAVSMRAIRLLSVWRKQVR